MATHPHAKPAGTPTWIDLMSPDAEAARTFYHAVFGWDYDIGGPEYGGYTTARLGGHATAGLVGNQPDALPMPAAWGLYFASDDNDADVARAEGLGAKVIFPNAGVGEFGSMAVLEDPTGAAFSFWQAGNHVGWQVSEDPGSVAWFELYSPDAKKARDFYMALLGATAEPMPGGLEYYILKHGDEMIAAVMQIDPSWGAFHPQWVTYFSVADADKAVATVIEHGGKAMSAIEDSPFGRMAALMAPDGAFFKIVETTAQ
ncbi:MAG: VOC family protein [Roseiflexaceae bacterium]|nr:VOC family protein [Roseiflexaceae bacterium]